MLRIKLEFYSKIYYAVNPDNPLVKEKVGKTL